MRYVLALLILGIVIGIAGCAADNIGNDQGINQGTIPADADSDDAQADRTGNDTSQNTTTPGMMTVSYQPVQCEPTPWYNWTRESQALFIREPTDEDMITLYYAEQYNITVYNYRSDSLESTCMECGSCKEDYVIFVDIDEADAQRMIDTGWSRQ